MEPSLAVSIGKMSLDGPAMLASGILGISLDVFGRLRRSGAAAIVSKSLSREPWEGYANPTIVGVGGGGWINAVGLSNPGAENFADMIRQNRDVPIIVSLVGSDPADFEYMTGQFRECNILGYELNLSCPHVAKVGLEVGDDLGLVKEIVSVVGSTGKPVIAKVGLGTVNYLDTVGAAVDAGADAITAINTVRAMAVDIHARRPVLSNGFGGLSGSPIKPIAVRCVYEITSNYDVPVIGCGGVSTWEDVVEFMLAGASAVQVGSAIGDRWVDVFSEINAGVESYMRKHGYSETEEMVGLARS
ncbi:MAG: dihydroorotate dehydrogenase [Nitrosopumilus sp. H8]|nr:MAG: dihydroorotate dehydrogenase [Nitrosopumilus sp. H13]RNJ80115.1 MAG: dihydroorotate dehydrogenase [Nitrosopumilus sp. H8]